MTAAFTPIWYYTPIVPEGIYDRINVLSEGIGTGPMRLTEYVQDDVISFEAFADYWQPGIPCANRLSLKSLPDEQSRVAALRAGEIDGATFSVDIARTLQAHSELQVLRGLTSGPRVIQFNMVKEVPWRDVRVRQAVSLVVDRQAIIDKVYGSDGVLTGVIPPGYGEYPLPQERLAELYTVDVERAKSLMQQAGLESGFSVTMQAISAPREFTQIAEIVREQVRQINIDVTVVPLEAGTFVKNNGDGGFEWASAMRGVRGDPSGYVVDFRSGTAQNLKWFGEGWKNGEIDAIYDAALAQPDQSRRPALYQRIAELIAADVPNLYNVQPYKYQAVRKRVTGMYVFYGNTNEGLRTACVSED